MATLRIPASTYRFQFHRRFRFEHATVLVPYLEALGITDLYASPIFALDIQATFRDRMDDLMVISPDVGGVGRARELAQRIASPLAVVDKRREKEGEVADMTVIGDVTAVFFGGVMTVGFLGVPYELYKSNTLDQLAVADFYTGLIKGLVFGVILSAIACHNGLRVQGGAAGVGRATTDTVVQTVVSVIIADLVFTGIFYAVGLT